MKRSEMIDLMAKVMEDNFDGDNGSWIQDAEKVLDAIEKNGMKPVGTYSDNPHCDCSLIKFCNARYIYNFQWDKE